MMRGGGVLVFCLLATCAQAAPRSPHAGAFGGTWRGSAVYKGARLELALRVEPGASAPRATISSPDLMLLEQPLVGVRLDGSRLHFTTPGDHGLRFECQLQGDTLRGQATPPAVPGVIAAGGTEPVRLALGRAPAPLPPPYTRRDIAFSSASAKLAGTLLVPRAQRPVAGIVILAGSSSNLRDDFLYQADAFARLGLEVLVFDKRGHGGSSGDYGAATYADLADDAAAAVERLRREPGVDSTRVGVWGLSQGAMLAPLVAARVSALAFIVAFSGPGLPIGEAAAYQDSVRLAAAGFDQADIRRAVSIDRRLYRWLVDGKDGAELSALLTEAADTPWRRASSLPARLPAGPALAGWYWRGRTLDPSPHWKAVRVPVLALWGAADELLPGKASATRVERALRQGGNRDVTVRVFPAANHVLRTLPLAAGGKWDWPRAAPGSLELVASWVRDRCASPARR